MIKIGLVGEDPNDTQAIKNLLLQKFGGVINFLPLIRNKRGYQLDNANTFKSLAIEFEDHRPDYVIFIRDADGIISEAEKIKAKQKWFNLMLSAVNNKGMFLLNIYELEALILCDIQAFNKTFHVNILYSKNILYQKEPKEFLKNKTYNAKRRFSESDCPEMFAKINYDLVYKNSQYFRKFHDEFQQIVQELKIGKGQ